MENKGNGKKLIRKGELKPPKVIMMEKYLQAIEDSSGNLTLIAERLGMSRAKLHNRLQNRSGEQWNTIRILIQQEREKVGDIAENTVKELMQQRMEPGTALRAATFHLTKQCKERGYHDLKVTVEGGVNPIKIQKDRMEIETLNLPLDIKKTILKAIEEKEAEEKGDKT